jgi:general secretion pathway protein N
VTVGESAERHRWPLLAAIGVALYAGFLLASAPAASMAWGLERLTQGAASLQQAHGSLWRGRAAALVVKREGGAPVQLRGLSWELLPSQLFFGRLAAALTLEDDRVRGAATVDWRPHRLRVANAAFTVSAAAIPAFFPAAQLARPAGEVKLRTAALTWSKGAVGGQAQIDWDDASSALSAVKPLGTYRVLLKGEGHGAQLELRTLKGALQIEGRGGWAAGSEPLFSGTARAEPARAAELRELLKLLGSEDQNGAFRLRWGAVSAASSAPRGP